MWTQHERRIVTRGGGSVLVCPSALCNDSPTETDRSKWHADGRAITKQGQEVPRVNMGSVRHTDGRNSTKLHTWKKEERYSGDTWQPAPGPGDQGQHPTVMSHVGSWPGLNGMGWDIASMVFLPKSYNPRPSTHEKKHKIHDSSVQICQGHQKQGKSEKLSQPRRN